LDELRWDLGGDNVQASVPKDVETALWGGFFRRSSGKLSQEAALYCAGDTPLFDAFVDGLCGGVEGVERLYFETLRAPIGGDAGIVTDGATLTFEVEAPELGVSLFQGGRADRTLLEGGCH